MLQLQVKFFEENRAVLDLDENLFNYTRASKQDYTDAARMLQTKRDLAAIESHLAQLAEELADLSVECVDLIRKAKRETPVWSYMSFADARSSFW